MTLTALGVSESIPMTWQPHITYKRLTLTFSVVAGFDNPHCKFSDLTKLVIQSANNSHLRLLVPDWPDNPTTTRCRGTSQVVRYSTPEVWRKEFRVEAQVPTGRDAEAVLVGIHAALDQHDWAICEFGRDYPGVAF